MGISKRAFEASNGFGNIHPGEDPDLSIRLWKLGFQTQLIANAFVYHKRRIDWSKFLTQVNKFGKARPILNSWYPEYAKLTFFFPTIFILGFILSVFGLLFFTFYLPILVFLVYFISLFISSWWSNKNLKIAFLSLIATCIQFYGYGFGFLKSFVLVQILKTNPESALPELFFKSETCQN
jgi:GT2 family glycosyltransferase